MSTITAPFLVLAAILALATWHGPGHQWAGLAVLVVWFFLCRSLQPRGQRWLLMAAIGLSVAVAALAVVQVVLWMPRARGPFVSPNYLGAWAVLMFFLAVGGQAAPPKSRPGVSHNEPGASRQMYLVPTAANLLSVALSQSRGAILALGAGLLVIAWSSRRWRLWASLASVAAVAAVFLIRPDTINSRGAIWRLGLQAAQQRLVTGWGQGGAIVGGLDHFYNIPLDLVLAGGIPALAAGAWVLYAAVRSAARIERPEFIHAFLAAWVAQGMFISGTPATWLTLVAVLGSLARPHLFVTGIADLPARRALQEDDPNAPPLDDARQHIAMEERPAPGNALLMPLKALPLPRGSHGTV